MKKLMALSTLILLATAAFCFAGGLSQGVQWTQGPSGQGTKIYVGLASGDLQYSYDGGIDTNTFTIPDLYCETMYYTTAAHSGDLRDGLGMQEGSLCHEISFTTGACMAITFNPMPELAEPLVLPVNLFEAQ